MNKDILLKYIALSGIPDEAYDEIVAFLDSHNFVKIPQYLTLAEINGKLKHKYRAKIKHHIFGHPGNDHATKRIPFVTTAMLIEYYGNGINILLEAYADCSRKDVPVKKLGNHIALSRLWKMIEIEYPEAILR